MPILVCYVLLGIGFAHDFPQPNPPSGFLGAVAMKVQMSKNVKIVKYAHVFTSSLET
jgi:hypothetical protein